VGIKFAIDNKVTLSHLASLTKVPDQLLNDAGDYFKKVTPIRTGNARNNTSRNGNVITADYDYASRLDEGSSRQAPKGMVDPTIQFIDKRLKQLVEKK
jgi:hypothetical protein